jgi:hypothetical protein
MTRTGVTAGELAVLTQPIPPEEIKQRQGPGGKMLDYIDARTVMDRLDELGADVWQDRFVDRADGSVRCGISILVDGEWVTKWDVGTESDIESDKGSYSDAFKRAGVKWGIGRELYNKPSTTSGRAAAASSARPVPTPRPSAPPPTVAGVPEEPDYLADVIGAPVRATVARVADEVASQDGFCPQHGLSWVLQPGGISKTTGKPYDGFWKCPSDDRPFCKQKPSKRWSALMEMAS